MKKKVISLMLTISLISLFAFAYVQPTMGYESSGTIRIKPDGSIDPPTAPILRNGDLYSLTDNISISDFVDGIVFERDNMILDGAGHSISGLSSEEGPHPVGINLTDRKNVTIRNIQIFGFSYDIGASNSSIISIHDCEMTSDAYGGYIIWLDNCLTVDTSRNTINNGILYGSGIVLSSSNSCAIISNRITNLGDGEPQGGGLVLDVSSENLIVGNTFVNCSLVVSNSYGNNHIYHNNFFGVSPPTSVDNSTNIWDNGYPSGGNYWSDYKGIDVYSGPYQNVTGSDGIGDTPYVIDSSNRDNYPLMNPWVSIESLVVRGMDSRIYYRVWNGAGWNGWNALPGSTIDSPAAAMLGNQLHVVVRGSDGHSLWYGYLTNITDPGSFSGWTLLNGATSSTPTLSSNGTALCLVVRGMDNHIYYRIYDNVAHVWQGWNALPSGTTCGKPAAQMLGGTLSIVVRGYSPTNAAANNTLWYSTKNLTNNEFSGWTMLGGATPSGPTLTAMQTSNSLYLTVRGNDNRIYVSTWNGSNWQGWNALPTGTTNETPATTIMEDKFYFVVIGMDGTSMWQSSSDPATSNFSGWILLSGAALSAPTLTS